MVLINVDNNLILRSFKTEDATALFDAVNGNRTHLHAWLNWVDRTKRPEHSLQFIEQSISQQHNQEGLALGIFYQDHIIGGIGMHHWDKEIKCAQIGYWVSKEYEGKGIINTCLIRLIDFLFEKTGLNKIEIRFIPTNIRSARVATRLGFKTEGIIRQSIINNGLPEDLVITGLLKSEWSKH